MNQHQQVAKTRQQEHEERLQLMAPVVKKYNLQWAQQDGPASIRLINIHRDKYPTIREMIDLIPAERMLSLVMELILHGFECVERKRGIQDPPVLARLAKRICNKYQGYTLQDLKLCLRMGIDGDLNETVMDSVDGGLIMVWLADYAARKRADNRYLTKETIDRTNAIPCPPEISDQIRELENRLNVSKAAVALKEDRFKSIADYCGEHGIDSKAYLKELDVHAKEEYVRREITDIPLASFKQFYRRQHLALLNKDAQKFDL